MEFKGTKGKWFIDNGVETTSIYSKIFPAGIDVIANVKNQFHHDQTKANALLISKAPEMLEMLEIIYQQVDFSFSNWGSDTGLKMEENIKQLIKEATEL